MGKLFGPIGWVFDFGMKFISSGLVEKITGFLAKASDNAAANRQAEVKAATDIVVAHLNEQVEARKAQKELSARHDKIVSWIAGAFAFHITMIVLDSVFHLGWKVDSLPAPMDDWEGRIVLALCCAAPTSALVKSVVSKVWK